MSRLERSPVAWVLNLDAEEELASGRRYAPTRRMQQIVRGQSQRLLGSLVQVGDIVLDDDATPGSALGFEGRAWCPTPRAQALLERAGASRATTPSADILALVNARPFATHVRADLAEAAFAKHLASDLERALHLLGRPAAGGWLVRRTFGAAGRGRRRIAVGTPTASELSWLEASLRRGPLVFEPWVDVTREFTRSGFVHADGRVRVAAPCFQETTAAGAWTGTVRSGAGEVRAQDDLALEQATACAGEALAVAGYFGPFGIDAFRYRSDDGEVLNPLSEINARYTMDWTLAMKPEVIAATPGDE